MTQPTMCACPGCGDRYFMYPGETCSAECWRKVKWSTKPDEADEQVG